MNINRIAIIGGGTAGWLAANHLGCELSSNPDIEIVLIESPDIPIIGVGEGTVPAIRQSLQRFGISEAEFIASCDATFKQGIKFIDWMKPQTGRANYYYHPFDSPFAAGQDLTPLWLSSVADTSYAEIVGVQEAICNAQRCPKKISSLPYQGEATYAYHLNAKKFAQLLAKNAIEKFGVVHQMATIQRARRRSDGAIEALITAAGEELVFDFYVDCSGFHSLLIAQELGVGFVDKSSQLLTNTALALQVPIRSEDEIPPYTLATAHSAGWIWDIALTERRGTGFVYSDAHMSDSEALVTFANYLGMDTEKLSPRKISMRVGYRSEFWAYNCVALGLAQGFVEPLEATSILVTDFSAEYLARSFPKTLDDIAPLRLRYNRLLNYVWERVIDFVKLHYCISDRDDSRFWVDNRLREGISEELQQRLAIWKKLPPKRQDFFSKYEVFDVENYLYVLYGMHFFTQQPSVPLVDQERAKMIAMEQQKKAALLSRQLPSHREWLSGFHRVAREQGLL